MTDLTEQRRLENDKRIADNIAKYGCHVTSVFDPDEKYPTFSYSIGIHATTGAPEAIVIGLSTKLGHSMINHYCANVRKGVRYQRGTQYPDYLDGFNIYFEPARPAMLTDYTLGCDRYYDGAPYPVVQMIYPTTSGIWPWRKSVPDSFRSNQPMLGRKFPNRP